MCIVFLGVPPHGNIFKIECEYMHTPVPLKVLIDGAPDESMRLPCRSPKVHEANCE